MFTDAKALSSHLVVGGDGSTIAWFNDPAGHNLFVIEVAEAR